MIPTESCPTCAGSKGYHFDGCAAHTMAIALDRFLTASSVLLAAWVEEAVEYYPDYVISFDELVHELHHITVKDVAQ